jgi:hypothetical protein
MQIQIQLYWPGLQTNEEFDFGKAYIYALLSILFINTKNKING